MNHYNSVRFSNIPKHQNIVEHLDNIFEQSTWLLETNFQNVKVFEHAKKLTDYSSQIELDEERTTIAFVQLADTSKHDKLIILFNGYKFHNYTLSCIPAYHDFNSMKKTYHFDWCGCDECDSFTNFIKEKEAEQDKSKVKQLYDRAIKFGARTGPSRQPTTSKQPVNAQLTPSQTASESIDSRPVNIATALTPDDLGGEDDHFYDMDDLYDSDSDSLKSTITF